MVEMTIPLPIFELSGNWLCLDFVNTVADRPSEHPREKLNSYGDLVRWSHLAEVLTQDEAQLLLEEAARRPDDAAAVLQQAITLRETIYRIFLATAEGLLPDPAELVKFNALLSEAMSRACIIQRADGFIWDWVDKENALDRMLWPLVRSAADLLVSEQLSTVRVCAAPDCNWLFLDTSKNSSRRWCDMKSCGNRAKVRRHYQRQKQSLALS